MSNSAQKTLAFLSLERYKKGMDELSHLRETIASVKRGWESRMEFEGFIDPSDGKTIDYDSRERDKVLKSYDDQLVAKEKEVLEIYLAHVYAIESLSKL